MDDVRQVLEERAVYGQAWALTGVLLKPVADRVSDLLVDHPVMFLPYIIIVNKLVRILFSPTNPDHWRDIAGYAELVLRDMEKK